jgi:Tol biopolymer transport system component
VKRVGCLLTLALALSLWPSSPSLAAFPGGNGKLAFAAPAPSGYTDLYVVNADGTNKLRLTRTPLWNELNLSWSPDGTRMAFDVASSEIWVMNADGTDLTHLDPSCDFCWGPAWSSDGSHLVFASNDFPSTDADIWVMEDDGSKPARLTTTTTREETRPAWSPDGSKIAFIGQSDSFPYPSDIYVMDANGSNSVNLTNDGAAYGGLEWSPNGTRIAFSMTNDKGNGDVYKMASNGTNRVRLTTNSASDGSPSWSPDGSKIAFTSGRTNPGLYLMNPDGSNQTAIPNAGSGNGSDWQPCPAACPSTVETIRPVSVIHVPAYGDSYSPANLVDLSGTASDEGLGVSRVEIALRQERTDGTCRWWDGSGFVVGRCRHERWLRAKGTEAWTYHLASQLTRSVGTKVKSYTLLSRAQDFAGNLETSFETGRNRVPFEIE